MARRSIPQTMRAKVTSAKKKRKMRKEIRDSRGQNQTNLTKRKY